MIGAQKAATTTLWAMLNEHPDIFLPQVKETNFFLDDGQRWGSGGLAHYEKLFSSATEVRHRGDASPAYTMFPLFVGVPERAAALVPTARLVYVIRDPIQRLISAWTQATTDGLESSDLEDAVAFNSIYLLSSSYGLQLTRWLAYFPREAVLVVRAEDLGADPRGTLNRVLAHLGLPGGWTPSDLDRRLNAVDDKLIARRRLRLISGALRSLGREKAATAVGRGGPVKRRIGLARPYLDVELQLSPRRVTALTDYFRRDFRDLREIVGPEIDLYDLA